MDETAVASDGSPRAARMQRAKVENERIAEMEMMFLNLVRNVEYLNGENAELGRRLGALELERVAEGVVR